MKKRILSPPILLSVWILFIFTRSLQPADLSASESQWVLDLIQSILPFQISLHFVRKSAHFIEFAMLGVLAHLTFRDITQKWLFSFLFTVMFGISVALCDETIQLFVSGRTGQIQDVWLDAAGAFTGVLTMISIYKLWNKRNCLIITRI